MRTTRTGVSPHHNESCPARVSIVQGKGWFSYLFRVARVTGSFSHHFIGSVCGLCAILRFYLRHAASSGKRGVNKE